MMTAAPIDIEHELLRPFQRLLLAIPIDLKRYVIMCRFLSIVLNLDDTVLDEQSVPHPEVAARPPVELLPNIAFPPDIWLRDDINIKDVKVKTTMLVEINQWLEQELVGTATDISEEQTLLYYEKLLQAYNFYDMPSRRSLLMLLYSAELVLHEKEHENDSAATAAQEATPPAIPSPSKTLRLALQKLLASPIHTTNNPKRVLALSREIINSRKRFLTLLGHQGLTPSLVPSSSASQSLAALDATMVDDDKPNSLLSKTKIYSKLKKNRELALLISSTTLGGYLNRNLVATTASGASLHGLRRRLLVLLSLDDHRLVAGHAVHLLAEQKRENRKQKLEYYLQLMKLYQITETILKTLSETKDPKMSNTKLVRFLEFLKKKVFRFVIVDISLMIMDYGMVKSLNLLYSL